MRVRWREHEMIFVTILVVTQILIALVNLDNSSFEHSQADFAEVFSANRIPFTYWKNVLVPELGIVLLMYLCYLSVNLLIIPMARKIPFGYTEKLRIKNVLIPFAIILIVGLFLALGVNAISYYARPYLFNYRGYQFLALPGYNDKPLTNLFFGFGRATVVVIVFVMITGVRELIIWLINKPGPKREFRILIANNLTPLMFGCFLVPFFTNPIHSSFMDYLAWTIPVLASYIYNTFWLFPSHENFIWWRRSILVRLLISTFVGAVFSAITFSGSHRLIEFTYYWLFLLLIITPLSWVLYQQRKDRILQVKGLEKELSKSTSALQFLRSQINPHFLFNALNTLYGTALKEKAEQTAGGIQILGDMMRFMLHDNNLDFIPMEKEIDYLKNYISLQKLRTPPSVDIRIDDNIEDVKCNKQIAPMLLIPLIENAFKYGISLKEKSWIDIKLECAPTFIQFEVRNSIHHENEYDRVRSKSGVGLKNISERLKLLYPGKHELNTGKSGNEFVARLLIN